MRITGGSLRGRKYDAPRGTGTRPTSDRAKVALFNILGQRFSGARVLDGFAGTGALSFEALSRGAASAVLFEQDGEAAATVRANASALGLTGQVAVHRADFLSGAAALPAGAFDVIFLDPPYASGLLNGALEASGRLLAPGGVVVAEHDSGAEAPFETDLLKRTDLRKYGAAAFSFYTGKRTE